MNVNDYENLLSIKTEGKQHIEEATFHYNRYEPTDYSSLEVLCKDYKLKEEDSVVDFGCGKGRLNFYLNYYFDCTITGIEYNNYLYKQALKNKKSYLDKLRKKDKINFECIAAEKYKILKTQNKFYFFNPFSIEIFMKVIDNILESFYEFNREIEIILFYASDEYMFLLNQYTLFNLKKEICLDNYDTDIRDRFLIYTLEF